MVQGISAIGNSGNFNIDPEYLRILQELYKLGIKPTGNKQIDKAKLEEEKQKIIQRIQDKIETSKNTENKEDKERVQMEEERLGAKTVGELNRILFGI